MLPYRGGELGKPLGVERRAGLLPVRLDELERDLGCPGRDRNGGRRRRLTKEHIEPTTESASCHQAIAPRSAIGTRALSRPASSRARSSYACAAGECRSYIAMGMPWLGASARRTVRGIRASATRVGKWRRTSSMTWIESRLRRAPLLGKNAGKSGGPVGGWEKGGGGEGGGIWGGAV